MVQAKDIHSIPTRTYLIDGGNQLEPEEVVRGVGSGEVEFARWFPFRLLSAGVGERDGWRQAFLDGAVTVAVVSVEPEPGPAVAAPLQAASLLGVEELKGHRS